MQSHAHQIQAILARELNVPGRPVEPVRAGLLTLPPHSPGIAAGAGAQASR
jgi:hypothetical protein